MQLVTSQYYNVWGYFWVPGAMRDFEIPDLARLVSPKPQIWIHPVNALGESPDLSGISAIIIPNENLRIITSKDTSSKNILDLINTIFY